MADEPATQAPVWLAKVHVLLKPVVNDPPGQAIQGGLRSLHFATVEQVRAGKYFEITLRAANHEEASALTTDMCRKLLANPVLEDFRFEIAQAAVENA
jgi:phosphoribosylformylglycinamidine synthase subunit PurS